MSALWLDANVIVRLMTRDDERQALRARHLLRRGEAGEVVLRLSPVIVAEVFWVLIRKYRLPQPGVAEGLRAFCASVGVETEERDVVLNALRVAGERAVDFPDAYLAAKALAADEGVASFDRDFERLGVRRTS